MDDYVEKLLDEGIINFEILNRSKYISEKLIEKYKDDLHLEKEKRRDQDQNDYCPMVVKTLESIINKLEGESKWHIH